MMDQLEFENLMTKLKKRYDEGDLKTAAKIADKIPWDEVEDINVLIFISNIYEEIGKYGDAKNILEYAYDIAPIKNRLYFPLAMIYIKLEDLREAKNYYFDFCEDFPNDCRKYLLKYYILKKNGAPYDQQKRILDEYVKEEKDEKMIYELALLSDKLDEKEEVIAYCDYIIKFFGIKKNGYGKKAMILKRKYQELTEEEETLLEQVEKEINENEIQKKDEEYVKIDNKQEYRPAEKIIRSERIETEQNDDDTLDETKVQQSLNITYTPDLESYKRKEKSDMAFLSAKEETDNSKKELRALIDKLKKEEREEREGKNDMKLSETKLNMIIEAHSKDEGVDIARKELAFIHEKLNEKFNIAKVSAYNINEKGFKHYEEKIFGKDLIIENAGMLKNQMIDEIEEYIIEKKSGTIFALVDVINNFDKILKERPSFIDRFDVYSVLSKKPQETLEIDDVERRDVVREIKNEKLDKKSNEKETINNGSDKEKEIENFVKECIKYAESIDCVIPKESVPVLYEKAEEMVKEKIKFTKDNAISIIEEAADRAEKPKLFSKPQYNKDGCLILLEEFFKF